MKINDTNQAGEVEGGGWEGRALKAGPGAWERNKWDSCSWEWGTRGDRAPSLSP